MKSTSTIYFKLLIVLLAIVGISNNRLFAQCGTSATVPTNYASWNWEEPERDPANPGVLRPAYCNTWAALVSTGTSVAQYPMGAPWIAFGAPALQQISATSDYRKANGWELVKLDFGGRGGTAIPYFVLYHKPTGVLRVFAYIVTTNSLNGIVFTMKHSPNNQTNSGHSGANAGLARYPVVAADKYLSQSSPDQEVLTYVSFYGGGQKWAMGQFTMLFDPNSNNNAFNLNSYQFQIHGLLTSDVKLAGAFQFKTNANEDSDFSFAGPASKTQADTSPGASATGLKILATGQKFLGDLSGVGSKFKDVKDKADAFVTLAGANPTGVVKDLASISKGISSLASNKTLTGITSVAGQLGGFFGIAGSVIGIFSGDAAGGSAFIPSVSKGTITLNGTITTQSTLTTFFLLTPATNHYQSNSGSTSTPPNLYSNLPYYNCPVGIFNIRNTPLLQRLDYNRATTVTKSGAELLQQSDAPPWSTYTLINDFKPVVNAASGMRIVSVKYAIGQKASFSDIEVPYRDSYRSNLAMRTYSYIYSQVSRGIQEVYPLDPGSSTTNATVIIQTPFTDASCLSSSPPTIPFSAPAATPDNPVFVRVVAELRRVNAPTSEPSTFFAQDYAPDFVNAGNYDVWRGKNVYVFAESPGGTLTPFNNPTFLATYPSYKHPVDLYEPNLVKSGQYTYNSTNLGEIANSSLTFTPQAQVVVQPTSMPVLFKATSSIKIEGTLSVPSGSTLTMSTAFNAASPAGYYYCESTSNNYETVNQACTYDLNANRGSLPGNPNPTNPVTLSVAQLVLYPNPAAGATLAQLRVSEEECIQRIDLVSMSGQVSWQKQYDCAHLIATEIPLSNIPKGLYIVRVTTTKRTYTTKLSVQ